MKWRIATLAEAGGRDEDRVAYATGPESAVIVLADGAGGTGSGATAAEQACKQLLDRLGTATDWEATIAKLDQALSAAGFGGETTVVVVELAGDSVRGASVGDSSAILVTDHAVFDLTEGQSRKPLVGSGAATPVGFGPIPVEGRLLLASDGLTKYAPQSMILRLVRELPFDDAPKALIEAVRLRSGALPDDVALAICERRG